MRSERAREQQGERERERERESERASEREREREREREKERERKRERPVVIGSLMRRSALERSSWRSGDRVGDLEIELAIWRSTG